MSDLNAERSKPWNIYPSSNPGPSQTGVDEEAPWKSLGTSMSAISFGFVATAILISMFLIMAIFEHLFKPTSQFSTPQSMMRRYQEHPPLPTGKQANAQSVSLFMPFNLAFIPVFPFTVSRSWLLSACLATFYAWEKTWHVLMININASN